MEFNFQTVIALTVFSFTYLSIMAEKINRTVIVLSGATLMIIFNVITQEESFQAIDFNTIFLLIGMMIVVNIMKRSGIFQYMAVVAAKTAGGRPVWILIFLSTITAITSAFLDNVTTVLMVAPVGLAITDAMGLHPVPFLLVEAMASNIGGTATLIGDPPNIMIASAAGLHFNSFLFNLTPNIIVVYVVFIALAVLLFRKDLYILPELRDSILAFDEKKAITDKVLVKKSLLVLAVIIIGFVFSGILHYEAATIALFGAAMLLLITKFNPEEALMEVEWSVIFFYIGLFIIVAAVAKIGFLTYIAHQLMNVTGNDPLLTMLVILWSSALLSAFFGNIPFVVTMIPVVKYLGTFMAIQPLWWALALGACLGGNGTITGASANLVVAGFSKREGFPITYKEFFRYGMPLMIVSIIISSIYLYLRYYS